MVCIFWFAFLELDLLLLYVHINIFKIITATQMIVLLFWSSFIVECIYCELHWTEASATVYEWNGREFPNAVKIRLSLG